MTSGSGDRRIFPGRDNTSSRLMERSLNEPPARSGHARRKLENGGTGMTSMLRRFRGAGVVAALIAGLALSACANKANDSLASAGVATPGSQQDFVVNVGDRVFFESDSTELTATSRGTLDKQAHWLQQYGNYTFTIEGNADERGTREYNIKLGA